MVPYPVLSLRKVTVRPPSVCMGPDTGPFPGHNTVAAAVPVNCTRTASVPEHGTVTGAFP